MGVLGISPENCCQGADVCVPSCSPNNDYAPHGCALASQSVIISIYYVCMGPKCREMRYPPRPYDKRHARNLFFFMMASIHQARANHYFRGAYLPPTNSGGCAFLAQPESGRVMAATVPKLKLAGGAFHGRDWSTVEAHLDLGEKLPLAGAQWLPASGQMQEHRQSLRSHGGSLYTAYIPQSLRIWAYGCWLS